MADPETEVRMREVEKDLHDIKKLLEPEPEPPPKDANKEFWGFLLLAALAALLQVFDKLTPEWLEFVTWGTGIYMVARAAPKTVREWVNGRNGNNGKLTR